MATGVLEQPYKGGSLEALAPGEEAVFAPLVRSGYGFYGLVGVLTVVLAVAAYAYSLQLRHGLSVTGLWDNVSWGLYIVNFVFFIGISHAGTLVSAILRVTGAEWRRPITRVAEAITAFALMVGAPMVIIDMGRPDRIWELIAYGRLQSPLLWDVISVTTYLTGSLLYLYLPMIPDLAACRDRVPGLAPWKRRLYGLLSLGWTGTERQKHLLERAIGIMAVVIIPVAVSVHTVVSWIFGMTLRTGWHSTIFGPYFVVGAIFSGIGALVVAMAIFRKAYHLERYLTPVHFNKLGYLLLATNLIYIYFTISEYLTAGYGAEEMDVQLIRSLTVGPYAGLFWTAIVVGMFIPAVMLAFPKGRTLPGVVVAGILVNAGMWLKRFLIVVPTMALPQMPTLWSDYRPTWIEGAITAGAFAAFILLFALFSKVFPIISLWEVGEGEHKARGMLAPEGSDGVDGVTDRRSRDDQQDGRGNGEDGRKGRRRAGVVLGTIAAIAFLSGLQATAPARAATAEPEVPQMPGTPGLTISLTLPEQVEPGALFRLTAEVTDPASGEPVEGAQVAFSRKTAFAELPLGRASTNANGQARILFREKQPGLIRVVARVEGAFGAQAGDGQSAEATGTVRIGAAGTGSESVRPPERHTGPLSSVDPVFAGSWAGSRSVRTGPYGATTNLGANPKVELPAGTWGAKVLQVLGVPGFLAVVGGVWLSYLFVLSLLWRLRHAG